MYDISLRDEIEKHAPIVIYNNCILVPNIILCLICRIFCDSSKLGSLKKGKILNLDAEIGEEEKRNPDWIFHNFIASNSMTFLNYILQDWPTDGF